MAIENSDVKGDGDTAIWEGEEIIAGGKTYILPPLNFAGMKRFRAKLQGMEKFTEEERADLFFEVVLWCFKRNYPSMTMDQLEEMADLKNFAKMRDIALNSSGFRRPGQGESPGKDPAGSST